VRPARSADSETIVAPATAVARGAVCLIRVSGPAALSVARAVAPGLPERPEPRRAHLADFHDGGSVFDRGLVTFFPGPRSFTGEDLLEFGLHGNPVLVARFLAAASRAGARLAAPGEFSRRAFLNGRMSLLEAESVGELVGARTESLAQAALDRLTGALAEPLGRAREELLLAVSLWTAAIDFPEQAGPEDPAAIAGHLKAARRELSGLAEAACRGPRLSAGLRLAIAGPPNAGKSTIFNRLVGKDRAIVTPHPGTTRDTVEEEIEIDGIPIRLVDTAGLRETSDEIEERGVERARHELGVADMVVVVHDASCDQALADSVGELSDVPIKLLILNKIDLSNSPAREGFVPLCALSPEAGEILRRAISAVLEREFSPESSLQIASARQADLVTRACAEIDRASRALEESLPAELALSHAEEALGCLGDLVGETTAEDALDRIFSAFCIGK
jgi:tRNA modification GTPase